MDNLHLIYSVVERILELRDLLPVIIIPVLISLKIMLGKKFNNWIFGILLSICLAYDLIIFVVSFKILYKTCTSYSTVIQKLNDSLGCILVELLPYLNYGTIAALLGTSIGTIIYIEKTKNTNILKKYFINFLFLGILFYLAYPLYYINYTIYVSKIYDTASLTESYEKAYNITILPPLKEQFASQISFFLSLEIDKYLFVKNRPEVLSEDVKKLLEKYNKYSEIYTKLGEANHYYIDYLNYFRWKLYDSAEEALKKADLTGIDNTSLYVDIYIKTGDYQKALNYLNNDNGYYENSNHTEKKEYGKIRIYIAQKKYNEALKLLNENKNVLSYKKYSDAKIYIDYKTGNIANAYNQFEKLKKYQEQQKSNTYLNKYTLDEYIKFLDSITF